MSTYEERKTARIERMRARAAKLQETADKNGLHLFSEEHSGIPLGQPILVGHHSERRHRRHLERIESRVRKHTPATAGEYFRTELVDALQKATPC